MFRNLKQILNAALHKRPLLTNTGVTVVLMTSGDCVQQMIENSGGVSKQQVADYDAERTKRVAIVGTLSGILMHNWYKFLDARYPGVAFRRLAKKIAIDQTIGSPIFIALFFLGMGALEGLDFKENLQDFIKKFPFVYAIELGVWTPCQTINFYFLSPQYRVVFMNVILFCYSIFLSYVKHND